MEPDPWITFWLAAGGAAAAIASGIGSIWALSQKRRYLPTPLMVTTVEDESYGVSDGERVVTFTAANRGDGIARDVLLVLHSSTGRTNNYEHQHELQHGAALQVRFIFGHELEEPGGEAKNSAGLDSDRFWAELTWRQAPNMKRVRRIRIRH